MYKVVFIVGIALIGVMSGDGGNAIVSANAISNYSYVNAIDNIFQGIQIARCVTGLGPNSTESNTALGRCYFNESSLPFVECNDQSSAIVQPNPAHRWAGVINIWQCTDLTTDVEGIYTCIIMNSSMIYESIKFGVYFIGRGKSPRS